MPPRSAPGTGTPFFVAVTGQAFPGCGLRPYPGYVAGPGARSRVSRTRLAVARISAAHPGVPPPTCHHEARPGTGTPFFVAVTGQAFPGCGLRPYPGYVAEPVARSRVSRTRLAVARISAAHPGDTASDMPPRSARNRHAILRCRHGA